jgi:hypothetical protein
MADEKPAGPYAAIAGFVTREPGGIDDDPYVNVDSLKMYCWKLTNMAFELINAIRIKKIQEYVRVCFEKMVNALISCYSYPEADTKKDLWVYFCASCLRLDRNLEYHLRRDLKFFNHKTFNHLKTYLILDAFTETLVGKSDSLMVFQHGGQQVNCHATHLLFFLFFLGNDSGQW